MTARKSDHRLAAELATAAGRLLLEIRGDATDVSDIGRRGDQVSNDYLINQIRRAHPADAVLSEESTDDLRRLDANHVWIVDPLDGTREFGELARDDWAVHVALWQGGHLVAGAVALPAREEYLSTGEPPPHPLPREGNPRVTVSRTMPPAFAAQLAQLLGADLVPMGSSGAKTAAVIRGDVDAYVHSGGMYEWDAAAPAAVATAAGLHVSGVDGKPLRFKSAAYVHAWHGGVPEGVRSGSVLRPELCREARRITFRRPGP